MAAAETTTQLFEKAVRLHSRRLFAIARAIVGSHAAAEDVLQQAVTNLFEHRDRYNWDDPAGLLRRTVVNEALRLLRQPRMSMVADDHPGRFESPAGAIVEREEVQQVRRAIEQLPEHFRAALVLCEYEGLSYLEIAEILDASVPQVKTWLHRGRRQLGEQLKTFMDRKPKGERRAEERMEDRG
jgi:RNA polymerase sigma factor (sigma-70 family)